jgi:hypothetical protein
MSLRQPGRFEDVAVPQVQDRKPLCREPLVAVPVAAGAVAGTVGFDDEAAGNRKSTMKGATGA